MNKALTYIYPIFFFLGVAQVAAQQYPFIQYDKNEIQQPLAISGFYEKLAKLEQGELKQVRILHIGDSHLQADFFSGQVRKNFHNRFGNAGRGFVFPYKVANTNGPGDYKSGSYGKWDSRRMVLNNNDLPIGLSGITLGTQDTNAVVFLSLRDEEKANYAFNQVTVFRQSGETYFDLVMGVEMPQGNARPTQQLSTKTHQVKSGETLSAIARKYQISVAELKTLNNLKADQIRVGQVLKIQHVSRTIYEPVAEEQVWQDIYCIPAAGGSMAVTMQLPQHVSQLYLRHTNPHASTWGGLIYGMSLEDSEASGVLYHSIGVNGAQFKHYNQAAYFKEQVRLLNPDLIIFSLGTNEAFARDYAEEPFYQDIDLLVSVLAATMPEAGILICSQPDTYLSKKYKNPRNLMIQATLENYSKDRFTGFWDLFNVMGGYGSIQKWYSHGLCAGDKVHFQAPGYRLQGNLLFDALMKGYDQYRVDRP